MSEKIIRLPKQRFEVSLETIWTKVYVFSNTVRAKIAIMNKLNKQDFSPASFPAQMCRTVTDVSGRV
jgi:hypothetical protein